jgi:hypothetical protein
MTLSEQITATKKHGHPIAFLKALLISDFCSNNLKI